MSLYTSLLKSTINPFIWPIVYNTRFDPWSLLNKNETLEFLAVVAVEVLEEDDLVRVPVVTDVLLVRRQGNRVTAGSERLNFYPYSFQFKRLEGFS